MTLHHEPLTAELQSLLDASPDAVLIADRAGTVVGLNRRAEQLFGIDADRLLGRPVEVLLPQRLRERHAAYRSAYSRSPTVRGMSSRPGLMALGADGTEFAVEVSLTPVLGSTAGLVIAVVHPVSERARLEPVLGGRAPAADALDALTDAILIIDARGRVEFLNRAAEQLTGCPRRSAPGRRVGEVLSLAGRRAGELLDDALGECLRTGVTGGHCEAVTAPDGGEEGRALDISTTPIRDPSGAVTGATIVARDVTHARLIARQLAHQATHDALTGLVNRSEFERRLERAVTSAAEEQAEHAVCFLDLDGFKQVNDACGHLAGDELLRQLSDLMRERMRSRDTLARLGGDEFGILLEHCRPAKAIRIAEGIRDAVCAHRFACEGRTHSVGASIGIAPIRGHAEHPGD
ncbi:MAG TPA: diguanylate cyclase, partial [Gemmatimonadales bacterium]